MDSSEFKKEIVPKIELNQGTNPDVDRFFIFDPYVDLWLKGVGAYYLTFIFLFHILFDRILNRFNFISEERLELIIYLILVISSLYLPLLFGQIIDLFTSIVSKIIKNWQSKKSETKLGFFLAWMSSLALNGLAIKKITAEGSYGIYLKPRLLKELFEKAILSSDLIVLLILAAIILTLFLSLVLWYDNNQVIKKFLNERNILLIVLILIALFSWKLVYDNSNLYHLNVFLFPLVSVINHSPSVPLVSDGFLTIYGGYFLWMQIPLKILGSGLLPVQTILCFLVLLQILMYFLICRYLIDNHLIRILVFITSTFWSYLFFRMERNDIYFQYFPLRLLFPSIFILCAYAFQSNTILNKAVLSVNYFSIKIYDILLIVIVSLALLNNLDSGLSTLGMYIALYGWEFLKSKRIKLNHFIVWTVINLALIVALSLIIFKLISGNYPNLSLYIFSVTKFGAGFFGLRFPNNLWMLFVIFYTLTLIQYSRSSVKGLNYKFNFSIAVWGLIGMLYFVNRSHPYNLLHISFPFFLCCGLFLEQSLNSLLVPKQILTKTENNFKVIQLVQVLLPGRYHLLKVAFSGILLLPFLTALIIACIQFIPAISVSLVSLDSNNYTDINRIKELSEKVYLLEKELNRPSILIGDPSESYYYLLEKRKILFYPEVNSIFDDKSFEKRFTHILDIANPIVTLCPFNRMTMVKMEEFTKLLAAKNFKFLQEFNNCKIYLKD